MKVSEIQAVYKRTKVNIFTVKDPEAVFDFLYPMVGQSPQENFICLYLDNKNRVRHFSVISKGTATETIVHPRDIFRDAFLVNAVSIILAHNHPSGEPTPSTEDIKTTTRIKEVGQIMGIQLLDHVIIGEESFSMREHGYL